MDTLKKRDLDPNSFARITETELNDAISNLSKGKTCGEDKIDNEHIIHNGPILRTYTYITLCCTAPIFRAP